MNSKEETDIERNYLLKVIKGFLGGSVVKHQPANAGDTGSITGLGRSPGEGNVIHSSIPA